MYCSKCGKRVEDGTLFCPNCGAAIKVSESTKQTVEENKSLEETPIINQAEHNFTPGVSARKSKVVAALLALFLGIFGVHNFYLGYSSKGVAQLLITLLSVFILSPVTAIWSFVEFILILTDTVSDADGNSLE